MMIDEPIVQDVEIPEADPHAPPPARFVSYTAVSDVRWVTPDHTHLNCMVTFPNINGGEAIPYTAVASDPGYPHSEEIFARAVAGDFGPVAPYIAPQAPVPVRVSSRQFRLHLLALGLLDTVEGWIDTQPLATQIAYQSSATFERTDAMMQAGFDALGFDAAAVDAFFVEAAGL